jgi:hypothetical protein
MTGFGSKQPSPFRKGALMPRNASRPALIALAVSFQFIFLAACTDSAKTIGAADKKTPTPQPATAQDDDGKPFDAAAANDTQSAQSGNTANNTTPVVPVVNETQSGNQVAVQPAYIPPALPPVQPTTDTAVVAQPAVVVPTTQAQPQQPVIPVQPAQPVQPAVQPEATNPVVTIPPATTVAKEGSLLIPVTPFSNMASGYQATNPGFRAILKDQGGKLVAAGPVTMDSVINGYSDDASSGSAYGRLVLSVDMAFVSPEAQTGQMDGAHQGTLSICMASDTNAGYDLSSCKNLDGNLHPERPFQWLDKPCSFDVKDKQIKITSYSGNTGEGGTRSQIALAVYHPAFGFAAPGKAFKDYQSPLVLDLDRDAKLDLVDVWDESQAVSFDLAGSGKAVRTGWVGRSDALLALDLNGDGAINDGRELFGEFSAATAATRQADDLGRRFTDGFQALAQYDLNRDGRIDAKDKIFSALRLWTDANSDGVTQKGELRALREGGVKEISLAYVKTSKNGRPETVFDNDVRLKSSYVGTDGKRHLAADVWFKQRRYTENLSAK